MRSWNTRPLVRALEDRVTPAISITGFGPRPTETFSTLAISGTNSTVPVGWAFSESGIDANTTYTSNDGNSATGDTFSLGTSGDRAFGGLQSGNLIPTIGVEFANNTGGIISRLGIVYTGEQWRLGELARVDRLDFQYSLNATSLTTGTWIDVNALDFTAPVAGPTVGALDGNLAANRTVVSSSISALSIANGSTFWIRWTDFDATGADDSLAVDDFTLIAGDDFAINTYTTGNQGVFGRSVAVDADGDAVVVWESNGQDGSGLGIYGQRFNAAGAKVGVEFQVNTHTTGIQRLPSVAVDADGDAVVVWMSYGQDGSGYGIYGQRFNAAGAKVGGEFLVNTYTTSSQQLPSVAVDADGDTVVVWRSFGQDGSDYGIYGQRFNAAGAKVAVEFQVNSFTTSMQGNSSVAVDAGGDAVVVWQSYGQDGGGYGTFGQRFNAAGAKVGGEFQVNSYTSNQQTNPSVAVDADGDAVVVWNSLDQDGSFGGIYGQRFNAAGAKVGVEFQVNTYTSAQQSYSSVAVDADGDAVVVWRSFGQDGSGFGMYGQRFGSPNPAAKVSNIQVNPGAPGVQRSMVTSLRIAFDSKVGFVGNPSAAFSLVNQMTSNAVTLSAAVDGSGALVTLSFTGGSVDLGGSVSDGRYTLTIIGNQFTGNGFDGNSDGIPGDNYTMIGTPANGLFRLFGDADGDGSVAANDFIQFRLSFGGINPIFDFDGDGSVAASDFIQFRLRFGGSI